jgi:uracil-DNA glycosylase
MNAKMRPGALTGTWAELLADELDQDYMQSLRAFLLDEKRAGKKLFPQSEAIFNAFLLTPFEQVKVVILGQDPYHGEGQAHGLSFSVPEGVPLPPSLQNIYKEIEQEFTCKMPSKGTLTHWAEQGVLLLNSVLTVQAGLAGSHQGKGWERFTDRVVQLINQQSDSVVFMLWGSYAKNKGKMIDAKRHCILTAPHPSPLSAYRGFFGCGHFAKANQYLEAQGKTPIDWAGI